MFDQTVFNIALAISGFLGGWVLKVIWDAVRDLQEADRNLVEKVNTIEIMVTGRYVTRDEFKATITALFAKLDRIEDKISTHIEKGSNHG